MPGSLDPPVPLGRPIYRGGLEGRYRDEPDCRTHVPPVFSRQCLAPDALQDRLGAYTVYPGRGVATQALSTASVDVHSLTSIQESAETQTLTPALPGFAALPGASFLGPPWPAGVEGLLILSKAHLLTARVHWKESRVAPRTSDKT